MGCAEFSLVNHSRRLYQVSAKSQHALLRPVPLRRIRPHARRMQVYWLRMVNAVGSVTMLEIPQARMAMLWSHEHFPAYMMDFEEDDCTFDLGQSCFPAAREEQWPTSHMPRALQPSTTLTCQLRRTHVYSGFRTKDVNVCTVGSSILRRLKSSSETGASPIVLTTL